ncbi:MAG: hypothetical protein AAGF12_43565 [Myxococcota bacterium]
MMRFLLCGLLVVGSGCSALTDTDPSDLQPGATNPGIDATADRTVLDAPLGDGMTAPDGDSPDVDVPDAIATPGRGIGDPEDCGGERCGFGQACIDGQCRCRPGLVPGPNDNTCQEPTGTPDACGMPPRNCPGRALCSPSGCVRECSEGLEECEGVCVDRSSSIFHCGGCDNRCGLDEVCVKGDCERYVGTTCNACPCAECGEEATCCTLGEAGALSRRVFCVPDEDGCPARF